MSIWSGATVLLTGGTGWFGRAFTEHALDQLPIKALRIFSRDEHKQHAMRQRWSDTDPGSRIRYIVGDVRDADRLKRAMQGVDICVTAAALKRVEGSSTHARELLKTNTLGAANVIDASIDCGVKRTLYLSSDKAAMPTNCYGKSKALAEDLMIEANSMAGGQDIRFASCRYGNILGSTGSVLDLWRASVEAGQPIPLTDEAMTRFYMPVSRSVELVVKSVDAMRGGEIFCPVMPRVRVVDLAEAAHPGWPHRMIGERAGGEKWNETLIGEDEARHTTRLPWAYVIEPQDPSWNGNQRHHGPVVEPGFSLRSDQEPFASAEEILGLLEEAGLAPALQKAA